MSAELPIDVGNEIAVGLSRTAVNENPGFEANVRAIQPALAASVRSTTHMFARSNMRNLLLDDSSVLFSKPDCVVWMGDASGELYDSIRPSSNAPQSVQHNSSNRGDCVQIMFNQSFSELSQAAQQFALTSELASVAYGRDQFGRYGMKVGLPIGLSSYVGMAGAFVFGVRKLYQCCLPRAKFQLYAFRRAPPVLPIGAKLAAIGLWGVLCVTNAIASQAVHQVGLTHAINHGLAAGGVEFYRSKQWKIDQMAYDHPGTWGVLSRFGYGFHGLVDHSTQLRRLELVVEAQQKQKLDH